MCIIIEAPTGVEFDAGIVYEEQFYNSDGVGLVYWDKGKRVTARAFSDKKQFKLLDFACSLPADTPRYLHMRIATHGSLDLANVHPFRINQDWLVMHNGVMGTFAALAGTDKSDTARFAEWVGYMSAAYKQSDLADPLTDKRFRMALRRMVGYSRLVFIHRDPERSFKVDTDQSGYRHGGCWYSHMPEALYTSPVTVDEHEAAVWSGDWSMTSFSDSGFRKDANGNVRWEQGGTKAAKVKTERMQSTRTSRKRDKRKNKRTRTKQAPAKY